jgi:hypothetical protein
MRYYLKWHFKGKYKSPFLKKKETATISQVCY